jgi:mannose-1-phosphate guanylyltransferase
LRRNTAPAIAYSLFHIQAINPEANIVVAPSDHLILKEDLFLSEIERGLDFVEKHPVLLTLGIKPNRPETGYGYIQESNEEVDGIRKVKTFTEKPNLELARVFYESGEFVWNSGIFLWNVKAILEAFKIHLPDIVNKFNEGREFFNTPREKEFIDQAFPFCSSISIDYGIMEKADNVYVIGSDFGWSDLGTWGSLHEITPKDENNNASLHCKTLYVESNDNVVAMSDDKLVVIQGLEGYIVAESEKALLICKKEEEQRIKHFVTDVKFRFGDEYV